MYKFIKEKLINCDIPYEIDETICKELATSFGLQDIDFFDGKNYPKSVRKSIDKVLNEFFIKPILKYEGKEFIYASYYLPNNMYKIWIPLIDLSNRVNVLQDDIVILDIGCGPGTSTFGLLDFYKNLALENPLNEYTIKVDLLEQEKCFINLFKSIYRNYQSTFPVNLKVQIRNIFYGDFFKCHNNLSNKEYDLIYASNVFNSNENNSNNKIVECCKILEYKLKDNSSIIFIEPAAEKYSIPFKRACNKVEINTKLNIYSPCFPLYRCECDRCVNFSMATINNIKSKALDLIKTSGNKENLHKFDYVIFRNDGLRKYDYVTKNRTKLKDVDWTKIGDKIKITALILTYINKDNGNIALKLCDGTMHEEVWLNIDEKEKKYNSLDVNFLRGEKIDLQQVLISGNHQLKLTSDTKIKVNF